MTPEQQEASLNAEGDLGPYECGATLESVLALSTEHSLQGNVIAFKFGGTSLLGADRMLHAARLVQQESLTRPVTAVVSAMKGVTDRLLRVGQLLGEGRNLQARKEAESIAELHRATLEDLRLEQDEQDRVEEELVLLADDLLHETPLKVRVSADGALLDRLASFGERYAARLFAAALAKIGVTAVPVASSDFVLTCDNFRDAKPQLEDTRSRGREILLPLLEAGIVPVVTGFIGATEDGRITTLGRNSSDFSGALIAHVVNAEELVIWTDVDGIYTANPHESAEAKLLHELSYDEAHALAASGAKVLHPHVLPLASQTEMTVWVRNTFKPQARGTRIGSQQNGGLA
ncbi:MAG TPA: aspartate kinase [Candidatus Acidoferrum sp.]|nr:aspartate kinase [Candidatus Acidoferrum sp.]